MLAWALWLLDGEARKHPMGGALSRANRSHWRLWRWLSESRPLELYDSLQGGTSSPSLIHTQAARALILISKVTYAANSKPLALDVLFVPSRIIPMTAASKRLPLPQALRHMPIAIAKPPLNPATNNAEVVVVPQHPGRWLSCKPKVECTENNL